MSEPTMTPQDHAETVVRQELEKAASLISGARRLMAEGRSVELGALEDRVRTITTTLHDMPADTQSRYKEHLEVLLEILDSLQTDMEDRHKALEDGLDAIKRREATGAYGQKDKP